MNMIEGLCNQIWSRTAFQRDLHWASSKGARLYFSHAHELSLGENSIALSRLIQSALTFSLSTNSEYRQVAYQIAVLSRNIITNSKKNRYINYNAVDASISLIFSRLGNFPAEKKYIDETKISLNTTLPRTLWFERENHLIDNTVDIINLRKIVLTDFQRQLWDAVTNFQVTVINAPTSAGKSFILQNHIINLLKANRVHNVLYIVPTRALIEQVIREIKVLLKNDTSDINISITEVPNVDSSSLYNIFVLTQERAQLLLEHEIQIDLAIIDEAQNVADNARGIILQSVIEEIKRRSTYARFVFATPFVKNPKVFLTAFDFNINLCKIIPIGESPVIQNLYSVSLENNNLSDIKIDKLEGKNDFKHICNLQSEYELSDERKLLAIIPTNIGKGQNNIIYGSDPSNCEYIASLISQVIAEKSDKIDDDLIEFSDYIKEHVHKDYLLAETVKHGVAYHYGNLPSFIRKGIERLCAASKIKYIVCTSTLLQGVNLPAQNIFIMKPSKGYNSDKTPIPLTAPEFWNLAGRAGRLTKDFEGNIFLINLNDWSLNPLDATERYQLIIPSFKKYVCDSTKGLISFINDKDHKSGDRKTQGLENAFMKLFLLKSENKLEHALNQFGADLKDNQKEAIIQSINQAAESITLPYVVFSKNPNVSVYRQQELYNYLIERITEKGPSYLIPPHPMRKFDAIKADYIRLFRKYDKYLAKVNNKQYIYFSSLALLWMRGSSYTSLLQSRIDHKNTEIKRGEANVNTEARGLFDEIEYSLRFKYMKFSKCYNDLLTFALQKLNKQGYETSIPPLHLFLELGASSGTMINLIGMGLSRTAAAKMVPYMINSSMKRDEIKGWLKQNNLNALGLPKSVLSEISDL